MRWFRVLVLLLLVSLVFCTVCFAEGEDAEDGNASQTQPEESLADQIAPEDGLDQQTLDLLGGFDASVQRSFGEELLQLFFRAVTSLSGQLRGGLLSCAVILASCLLCSLISGSEHGERAARIAGTLAICGACVGNLSSMIALAADTVSKAGEYSMLLLPSLSALGLVTGSGSAAVCTGAVFFLNLTVTLCRVLMIPLLWLYCTVSAADTALVDGRLGPMRSFLKWTAETVLKWTGYLFTGYLGVSGILAGSVGATQRRAARAAISNVVPMVGGILSDASDSLLAAAALIRGSAGVYGMLAVAAICIQPFLQLVLQWLLLKVCAALSGLFGQSALTGLTERLAEAMRLLVGLCALVCLASMLSIALCIKAVGL